MSLVRRLALKISHEVVIWSSPGAKAWAEGLEREVAFIESDWAALGWSLGSMRVLLDYRETPISSLDEVSAAFTKFASFSIYARAGMFWPLVRGPFAALELVFRRARYDQSIGLWRLSQAIWIFSFLCVLIAWIVERQRLKQQMSDDVLTDAVASTVNYKAALSRHCSLNWIPVLITVSYFSGWALEQGGFHDIPFFTSTFVLIGICYVLAIRNVQRIFQRRTERLDALLAEKSGAVSMDRMN